MRPLSAEEDGWSAVRLAVLRRDGGCVAVQAKLTQYPSDQLCRDQWGQPHPFDSLFKLQLDHVNEFSTRGRKAPDDEAHLQAVCAFHHSSWATKSEVRQDSRARLAALWPLVWEAWLRR